MSSHHCSVDDQFYTKGSATNNKSRCNEARIELSNRLDLLYGMRYMKHSVRAWIFAWPVIRNTENKGRGGLGDSHMVVTRTDAN